MPLSTKYAPQTTESNKSLNLTINSNRILMATKFFILLSIFSTSGMSEGQKICGCLCSFM